MYRTTVATFAALNCRDQGRYGFDQGVNIGRDYDSPQVLEAVHWCKFKASCAALGSIRKTKFALPPSHPSRGLTCACVHLTHPHVRPAFAFASPQTPCTLGALAVAHGP